MGRRFSGTGMGLFEGGTVQGVLPSMGDIFGFRLGQVAPAPSAVDPLYSVNQALVAKAKKYIAEFEHLSKLAKAIQNTDTRREAEAIINKKWYPPFNILNPFRSGKWDLNQLNANMKTYVALPYHQFVRFDNNFQVSRSRENYLESFRDGVKALRNFMSKIVALPVEIVDRGSEMLIATARSLAAKARTTMTVGDIAAAKVAAESARDSALPEGKDDIVREANALITEMEALAKRAGVPQAGQSAPAPGAPAGMDTGTMLLIGGGVVAVLGLAYFLTRK